MTPRSSTTRRRLTGSFRRDRLNRTMMRLCLSSGDIVKNTGTPWATRAAWVSYRMIVRTSFVPAILRLMACACRTILCAVSDREGTNFNLLTSPLTARTCPVPGSSYVPRSASTMLTAASSMYAKSRSPSSSTCS